MAAMTSSFDLRSIPGWFRLIALAEAVSWVGLLIGSALKLALGFAMLGMFALAWWL